MSGIIVPGLLLVAFTLVTCRMLACHRSRGAVLGFITWLAIATLLLPIGTGTTLLACALSCLISQAFVVTYPSSWLFR